MVVFVLCKNAHMSKLYITKKVMWRQKLSLFLFYSNRYKNKRRWLPTVFRLSVFDALASNRYKNKRWQLPATLVGGIFDAI